MKSIVYNNCKMVTKPKVYDVLKNGKRVTTIELVAAIHDELERKWVAAMWGGDELVEPGRKRGRLKNTGCGNGC